MILKGINDLRRTEPRSQNPPVLGTLGVRFPSRQHAYLPLIQALEGLRIRSEVPNCDVLQTTSVHVVCSNSPVIKDSAWIAKSTPGRGSLIRPSLGQDSDGLQ